MPAPNPALHLLQDFVNTRDIEADYDELASPSRAVAWLAAIGLTTRAPRLSATDHARLLAVREGIRALAAANNGEPMSDASRAGFNRAAASVSMVGRLDAAGRWELVADGSGVDQVLARLLGTLDRAIADGSWSRMKACRSHDCRWLFWDASRNRSGTWCRMSICGSRQKARAYRARLRA